MKVGTNIVPGARQPVGPKPPTCIGPFDHSKPSELDKDKKKRYPTGYLSSA